MSNKTTKRSRKRFKKFFIGIVLLFIVAMVLVALGPTFVNLGLGQGILASAFEKQVNGTVEFGKLDLGWFGPQEISGLTIANSNGEKALDLDIQISAGLYGLFVSDVEHLEIDITGSIKGTLREDGSTTFHDLIKQDEQEDPIAERSQAFNLGRTTVRFSQLTVELNGEDEAANQTLTISELSGELAYVPNGKITIKAQGKTKSSGKTGSVSIDGTIDNLIDERGNLSLAKTSARIDAELANIVLPFSKQQTQLQSATLQLSTDNMSKRVDLSFVVAASIESAGAGTLEGELSAVNIVGSDGSLDLSLDRITGQIRGKSVPTTLVQLLLEGTPILASRDIGPTIDVQADFTSSTPKDVSIKLTAKQFNAELIATVNANDGSIVSKRLHITSSVHPALLKDIADIEVEKRIPIIVDVTQFSMSPDSNGQIGINSIAAKGTITTDKPLTVTIPSSGLGKQTFENFRVEFETASLGQGLQIAAYAGENEVKITASRVGQTISIDKASAVAVLTPKMAAALQSDSKEPVKLTKPTLIAIDISPFKLSYDEKLKRYALNDQPIIANITAKEALLDNIPSLVEPVSLRDIRARITSNIANEDYAVKGSAIVIRSAHDQTLARLNYDLNAKLAGGKLSGVGSVTLRALQLIYLERMMGAQKGALSKWFGKKGELTATVNHSDSASATKFIAKFPYLDGVFTASLVDEMVQIQAETATITLQKAAIEASMNKQISSKDSGSKARVFTVANDVPLALEISKLKFPLSMLQSKPFDTAAVDLDITLTGGPLVMTDAEGNNSGINNMKINFTSDDIANHINFTLTETAKGKSARAGEISLEGKITHLVSEKKILQLDNRKLSVNGEVKDIPTNIADALLGLDGLLVAAVGPTMNSTFTAKNFSANSGAIVGELTTTNGSMKGRIVGRNNGLILPRKTPLECELQITPPLSQRLLAKIHPILADIRSTEQPVRISAKQAFLPLDNDISKLTARIEITIGKVEFDSGSITLGLLSILNTTNAKTIPGYIKPISVRIKKGIVTYERFEVLIGKYKLAYSGSIDLNTQMVNVRTELPLVALAFNDKKLEKYMDDVIVPLVTRGKFGNLETIIDPDFDMAGAIAKAGLKGFIESELGGKGFDIGKLIDKAISKGKGKK